VFTLQMQKFSDDLYSYLREKLLWAYHRCCLACPEHTSGNRVIFPTTRSSYDTKVIIIIHSPFSKSLTETLKIKIKDDGANLILSFHYIYNYSFIWLRWM